MEPKFNLDRPKISDEEINSKKDFGELVKQFKQQSIEKAKSDSKFIKNKKATYSAIIAGVAVICTVTYFTVFKKQPPKETTNDKIITIQTNNSTQNTKSNKAFIAPPISKLNVPYTSYKLKAEQGATIAHQSKSKIIIPKKAFVNKQGQEIIGDVEIRYREFHNQADIIASGIPMAYDSAGIKSHLESAGMLDIKGYQNGEPVFIDPKKQITIEFASNYGEDKYNMYVLDTVAKNWQYVSRDNSLKGQKRIERETGLKGHETSANVVPNKEKELQKQLNAIPPKIETEKIVYTKKSSQLTKPIEPLKPTKATAGRPKFELEVDYKEFPELSAFKNAVFEVGAENKNYKNNFSEITWSSAEISEGSKKGENYLLTLKLRERIEKLIVYPALTGADYEKAIDAYNKKFVNYKTLQAEREAKELKLKEEFEAKQAAYKAEEKKLSDELLKERIRIQKEQQEQQLTQTSVVTNNVNAIRVFNISNFGIHNSDCPSFLPKEAKMHPIFVINNGASFVSPVTTYLVCHNKNAVYTFGNEPLSYNPNDNYSLCVMASNGKMYVCDKETFSSCVVNKKNKIPVKELSDGVNNTQDLKIALGI
jgi:hypothetical protein